MTKVTEKNFTKTLATFTKNRKALDQMAHELAVFCIGHVHEHGDPIYLNEFWKAMGASYQGQFRRYVIAVCANDVNDLASSWLTILKKEWAINPEFKGKDRLLFFRQKGEKEQQLEDASELADKPPFTDIDVDTVKNPFANENIISSLKSMSRKAHDDGSKVSQEMTKVVDAALEAANKVAVANDNVVALPASKPVTQDGDAREAAVG